jgi:hypothetical protein
VASYRVQIWSPGGDFAPSKMRAEFENPKNLAYGSYINDVGEAYFTISQYDRKVDIRTYEGKGHVVIIRTDRGNADVVWRGILGEHDANERDVIFYAYGYEGQLFSLHSQWKKVWKNTKIAGAAGRPVNDMWDRVQALTDSRLQWVADGTLQAPWTTNAQTTDLTLNIYRVNWKPMLTIFKELTAIATSDTVNICYFEIDYPSDPDDLSASFNFWKDNTEDNAKLRLEYPNNIMDWSDRFTPVLFRNKTYGVGTGPRGQLYRFQKTVAGGTYGRDLFGMASQNMYLSWVRDRKELKRVIKRRTWLGLREDADTWVRCYPDSIAPWRATVSTHELGDRLYVKIDRGVTQVDKWMLLVGEQVVFVNGREYVQPMLEDRAGEF